MKFGTLFSGGEGVGLGLQAAGLHHTWGIEYNKAVAQVAEDNGFKMIVADVCNVDYSTLEPVDWLHASPVCTRASSANSLRPGECQIDLDTAAATIRAIDALKPHIFSLENVWQYKDFDSFKNILAALERNGYNYSVGLAQVNKTNFARYGLTPQTAFEACPNLHAGGEILKDCFIRANKTRGDEQAALRDAFSCYYSGNFITGYKLGYVLKVVTSGIAMVTAQASPGSSRKKNNVVAYRAGNTPTAAREYAPSLAAASSSALLF